MVIVRVRWTQKTKNKKQKSALFGGARGATKAPGPRTGEPWVDPRATVSDHGDRGARRRRQSSTLLSSSSSSFEPHAHAMSTSAMMQAVGETMHAYTRCGASSSSSSSSRARDGRMRPSGAGALIHRRQRGRWRRARTPARRLRGRREDGRREMGGEYFCFVSY